MRQASDKKRYIPALSFRWLTPLYDPLLKWVMREETFKQRLIQHANIRPGMKVLDLGSFPRTPICPLVVLEENRRYELDRLVSP